MELLHCLSMKQWIDMGSCKLSCFLLPRFFSEKTYQWFSGNKSLGQVFCRRLEYGRKGRGYTLCASPYHLTESHDTNISHGSGFLLRKFQQTPGTYPRYPKIPIWKDFLHKQVVEGLGYVPGVCWNFLRFLDTAFQSNYCSGSRFRSLD